MLSGKRERRPVSQTLVYNTHLLPRTPPSPPTTTSSLVSFSFFLYLFIFVFVLLSEASILYSFVALLITLPFIQLSNHLASFVCKSIYHIATLNFTPPLDIHRPANKNIILDEHGRD